MTAARRPQVEIEVSPEGEDGWTAVTLPYGPDTPFSVVPYDVLKSIGIHPESLEEVRIAGAIEDRNIGTAYFRYEGRVSKSRVVFPHPEDPCTWGWHAVYYLGWEIDAATGNFERTPGTWVSIDVPLGRPDAKYIYGKPL